MYGYHFDAILLQSHVIKAERALTYACIHVIRMRVAALIHKAYIQKISGTSAIMNEWGCRDGMHYAKNHGNKEIPLAILSRILA